MVKLNIYFRRTEYLSKEQKLLVKPVSNILRVGFYATCVEGTEQEIYSYIHTHRHKWWRTVFCTEQVMHICILDV